MKAPIRNVSDTVFTELTADQRKGMTVKMAAATSRTWMKRRDRKPARVQRTLIIARPASCQLLAHLLEEDCDDRRHQNEVDDSHRRSLAEIEELDGRQIVHGAEGLGAGPGAAGRQRKGN